MVDRASVQFKTASRRNHGVPFADRDDHSLAEITVSSLTVTVHSSGRALTPPLSLEWLIARMS